MLLFIVNVYKNALASVTNIEALLKHGHSVLVFIDGPTDDAEILDRVSLPRDRLHIVANPENLGLFGARLAAWQVAKERLDATKISYVSFVDGGADQIFPDCVSDFQDWTADVVEMNCFFRKENALKYAVFKRFLTGKMSPAHGFLTTVIINNVWNKYVQPQVLDAALGKLAYQRLNFGEDVAISGMVCAESRSWSFLDRTVYLYENLDTSLSRPADPSALSANYRDLKQAFSLVESAYAKHRFEVRALLWLKWQRNRAGTRLKAGLGGANSPLDRLLRPVIRESLKLIHTVVVSALLIVAVLRERRSTRPE